MEIICPYCENTIDHLDFEDTVSAYGYERGTCNVKGDNQDYNGDPVEFGDTERCETSYSCPDCGEEISSPYDIPLINDEEVVAVPVELNEDGQPLTTPRVDPSAIRFATPRYSSPVRKMVCPKCGYANNPIEDTEHSVICIKCDELLDTDLITPTMFGTID